MMRARFSLRRFDPSKSLPKTIPPLTGIRCPMGAGACLPRKEDMPFESKPHFIEGMTYPLAPDAQKTPPEACVFSIGDKVTFTNDYGVEFHNKVITGFSPTVEHGRFVYLDKDSWWFPVSPDSLSRPLESRQAAADLQYQGYDFGDGVEVTDHDGWEHTTPGDEWTRKVYVETDSGKEKLGFTVRFEPGSAKVREAYAIDMKGSIWGIQMAPASM